MSQVARPVQRLSRELSADAKAFRFVTRTGGTPGAGAVVMGPTSHEGKEGDVADIVTLGTATVEIGGAVADGADVQTDAEGRAIAQAGGGKRAGYALEAGAARGDKIEVFINPEY